MVWRKQCNLAKETQWRSQLAHQAASGLSIAGWCRRQKISNALFHFWKRTIAQRDEGSIVRMGNRAASLPTSATFVRVRVSEPAPAKAIHQDAMVVGGPIEILLKAGLAVRVAPGFDEPTLGRVLEILRDLSC